MKLKENKFIKIPNHTIGGKISGKSVNRGPSYGFDILVASTDLLVPKKQSIERKRT